MFTLKSKENLVHKLVHSFYLYILKMVNFMVWIIDKFGDARKVCIFAA